MEIIGPRLLSAKIAAGLLAIYAVIYGFFLLILAVSMGALLEGFPFAVGLFAMAATPFVALVYLGRASDPLRGDPVRPILMALMMAVPTVFWLYWGADSMRHAFHGDLRELLTFFGLTVVPGLLALWVCLTFVVLALRRN